MILNVVWPAIIAVNFFWVNNTISLFGSTVIVFGGKDGQGRVDNNGKVERRR